MLDHRGQLLRAALVFAGLPSYDRSLWALRTWLDSWAGIGRVAVGMAHQGFDLQLTRYDERGWRATFYTTGMEHSPTSATGTAWERTSWHATRRGGVGGAEEGGGRGMNQVASSVLLFVLAGLAEIGGGYLVWLWWRDGRAWPVGIAGALALVLYGIIPTYQPAHFGRVYAAYGGVFIVLSVLWGWGLDRVSPDRYDIIGALICLLGVTVIMYAPRSY